MNVAFLARIARWAAQFAVVAVVVWLFAPGDPPRSSLGYPTASVDWTDLPERTGFEAVGDAPWPAVRLTQGANLTPPGLLPQQVEGAFTISIELVAEAHVGNTTPLLSRWATRDGGRSFVFGLRKGGLPFFVVSGNGRKEDASEYREIRSRAKIPLHQPIHLAAVYEPNERMALFLDGRLVAQAEGAEQVPSEAFPSREPILLGSADKGPRWTSATFRDLPGVWGPVEIFDRAFDEQAIARASEELGYPMAPDGGS